MILGLVIGKPLGIAGFAWLAVRTGLAGLPANVTWLHIIGAGMLAGIGFTMSLFVGSLAYSDPEFVGAAKLGILAASALATIAGLGLLFFCTRRIAYTAPVGKAS